MFEYNGKQYTQEQIEKLATDNGMVFEDYLEYFGITRILESSEDFQNPTMPGAIVGGDQAPDMGFKLENGSSGFPLPTQVLLNKEPEEKPKKYTDISMNDWRSGLENLFPEEGVVGSIMTGIQVGRERARGADEIYKIFKGAQDEASVEEFVDVMEKMNQAPQIESFNKWSKAYDTYAFAMKKIPGYNNIRGDLAATIMATRDEGAAGMFGVFAQSIASMMNKTAGKEALKFAGPAAAGGAAAGTASGPFAPVTSTVGAITYGSLAAMSGASKMTEQLATFSDMVQQEILGNPRKYKGGFNEKNVYKVIGDKELFEDFKRKSLNRGWTIASVDFIGTLTGAKIAGPVMSGVTKAGGSKVVGGLAATTAVGGTESTFAFGGELGGQYAAGQEFDVKEAIVEALVEPMVGSAPTLTTAALGVYRINGEPISREQALELNKLRTPEDDFVIEVDNDPDVAKIIDDKSKDFQLEKDIDPELTDKLERAAVKALESQRAELLNTNTRSGKTRLKKIEDQIDEITDKVTERNKQISDTNQDLVTTIKSKKSTPTEIESAKNKLVQNNEGIINEVVNNNFNPTLDTTLTKQDFKSEVLTEFSKLINSYNIEKGTPFGAYVKLNLPKRVPGIFDKLVETKVNPETGKKEIIAKQDITDTQIEGEVTTQKEVKLDTEKTKSIKNKLFTAKLGFDKKFVPGQTEKTFADIFSEAVAKTFGTSLPEVTNKNFVKEFQKKNRAELTPIMQELMKKDKDTGIDNFKIFLEQNFDAVINQLPQNVINKKYKMLREAVLDEEGKQQREGTPEGKGIFKRVAQEKSDFINYFTDPEVGSSTRSDRKQSLLRTLVDELSADAALEVTKDQSIMDKFKEVQEVEGKAVPDDFLDLIVKKLDRGIDYLNNLQKNNGTLHAGLGLPELSIQALKVFLQTTRAVFKTTKNFSKALNEGVKKVQELFDTAKEKAIVKEEITKTFKSEKDITFKNTETTIQRIDSKVYKERSQKVLNNEIADIKKIKGKKQKIAATYNLIKNIIPSYTKGKKSANFVGTTAKATLDYLRKKGIALKKDGFTVKQSGRGMSIFYKNEKIFNPIEISRPTNINEKFQNKGKDNFLRELNEERPAIDRQAEENADTVVKQVSKLIQQGKVKEAKHLLTVMQDYSDSPLRLSGKLGDFDVNLKVGDKIMYEHTPPINDLKKQIEALIDNFKEGDNINILEKNIKGVLNRSFIDLINQNLKKEMQSTPMPKNYKPGDDRKSRYKGLDIELAPIYNKKYTNQNKSTELNEMLERTKGVPAGEKISIAKAKIEGFKSDHFKLFMRNSAEDLLGLLYRFAGKKEQGNADLKWIKETFTRTLTRANLEFEAHQIKSHKILQEAKALIGEQKIDLTAEAIDGYTVEQAIRIHLWTKRGYVVPGMDEVVGKKKRKEAGPEQEKVNKWVRKNFDSLEFTDAIEEAYFNNEKKYPEPNDNWVSGTITTDLLEHTNEVTRAEIFQPFFDNVNEVFGNFDKYHGKLSGSNVNKIRSIYGNSFVDALESSFYRIGTGRNRSFQLDKQGSGILDWVNNAIGNTMFINTRSSLLQTISSVNFINLKDNNPIAAAKAFKNQPKFWNYFNKIFFSDYLKQRRAGLRTDVNEQEIASAAANSKNPTRAVIATILKKGFWPTQMADSFAIAFGGSSFLSNREAKYKKEGMSNQEAFDMAFEDMREIAEDTQQSGRPEKISMEQSGFGGRLILAFQNTPMQYNRQIKKAFLDLKNGRGDWKTNVSKISNYLIIQNVIFHSMQQALFAVLFDEPEDEKEELKEKNRKIRVLNGMVDSILRGTGVFGAGLATAKNTILKIVEREGFDEKAIEEIFNMSPPIGRKTRQLFDIKDKFTYKQNLKKMKEMGIDTENPAVLAAADALSFGINLPSDRILRKVNNLKAASDKENEMWQRIALVLGYSKWDVNIPFEDAKDTSDKEPKRIRVIKPKRVRKIN